MGQTLANHSYVNLSLVRHQVDGNNSVQYHTDLWTCCSRQQGFHRGDWFLPNGTRLPFSGGDIYESRVAQTVDLHRINNATSPTGIYCCDIETKYVDDSSASVKSTPIYVGLYDDASKGKERLSYLTLKELLM